MELIRVQDSDYRKTYELYMTFDEDENGFINSVYGYDYDRFLEWIEMKRNWSLGKGLPEGFVPDTSFVLSVDGEYVGVFNLRHYLNDFLRNGPGHIGYGISKKYRGHGYATEGLKMTIGKAREIGIHEAYLSVNKDNPASLQVQLNNGAYIHHEDDKEYYTRINAISESDSREKLYVIITIRRMRMADLIKQGTDSLSMRQLCTTFINSRIKIRILRSLKSARQREDIQ